MASGNDYRPAWGFAASLLALLLLTSCGSGKPDEDSSVQQAPGFAQLPLPSALIPGPPRTSSDFPFGHFRDGADYFSMLPHQRVSQDGPIAEFAPAFLPGNETAGALAYAIYSIDLLNYEGEFTGRLLWDGAAPASGNAWLALGDRVADRWKWFPVNASEAIALGDVSRFENPETGEMFCAVVVLGGDTHRLKRLRFGQPAIDLRQTISQQSGVVPFDLVIDPASAQKSGVVIEQLDVDWNNDGLYEDLGLTTQKTYSLAFADTLELHLRAQTDEGIKEQTFVVHALQGEWGIIPLLQPQEGIETYSSPFLAAVDDKPLLACIYQKNLSDTENLWETHFYYPASQIEGLWDGPFVAPSVTPLVIHGVCEAQETVHLLYSNQNPHHFGFELFGMTASLANLSDWSPESTYLAVRSQLMERNDAAIANIAGTASCAFVSQEKNVYFWNYLNGVWDFDYTVYAEADASSLALGAIDGLPSMVVEYEDTHPGCVLIRAGQRFNSMDFWPELDRVSSAFLPSIGNTSHGPAYYYDDVHHDQAKLRSTDSADGSGIWHSSPMSTIAEERVAVLIGPCLGFDAYLFLYNSELSALYEMNLTGDPGAGYTYEYENIDPAEQISPDFTSCVCEGRPVVAYQETVRGEVRVAFLQ